MEPITTAELNEDGSIVTIIDQEGEVIRLRPFFPIEEKERDYFHKNYSQDKGNMVYKVICDMFAICNFTYIGSDREKERERIGIRIREIRQQKNFEAKYVAKLAGIDAANLSRIEQGRYSVGFDILCKIANVLGKRIDFVEKDKVL